MPFSDIEQQKIILFLTVFNIVNIIYNMEHTVMIGINVDDEAIKRNIDHSIQRKVEESILNDVKQSITNGNDYSSWAYKGRIEELIKEATNNFLENNSDKIIEMTSKKLVEKLARTKAVKEMVDSTINSLISDK